MKLMNLSKILFAVAVSASLSACGDSSSSASGNPGNPNNPTNPYPTPPSYNNGKSHLELDTDNRIVVSTPYWQGTRTDSRVAMNENGDAVVLWAEHTGGKFSFNWGQGAIVIAQYTQDTDEWSDPRQIDDGASVLPTRFFSEKLSLNIDYDSDLVVAAWRDKERGALVTTYTSDFGWQGNPTRLQASDTAADLDFSSPGYGTVNAIAFEDGQKAMVIWENANGMAYSVFDRGTNMWSPQKTFFDGKAHETKGVDLISANGALYAAWTTPNADSPYPFAAPDHQPVRVARFSNGAWVEEPIQNAANFSPWSEPVLGVSKSGPVIVWTAPRDIAFAKRDADGTWEAKSTGVQGEYSLRHSPHLAYSDNGDMLLSYLGNNEVFSTNTHTSTFTSQYNGDLETWGPEQKIYTLTQNTNPHTAIDGHGHAIMVSPHSADYYDANKPSDGWTERNTNTTATRSRVVVNQAGQSLAAFRHPIYTDITVIMQKK